MLGGAVKNSGILALDARQAERSRSRSLVTCGPSSDHHVVTLALVGSQLTINPAHLSDDDWEAIRAFLDMAKEKGEVVELSSRVELLTPAEVARRLGMSRSTVLRRIAGGELVAVKVGTHHRVPLAEFERYSHELMRRMAKASAEGIDAELIGE